MIKKRNILKINTIRVDLIIYLSVINSKLLNYSFKYFFIILLLFTLTL